MREKLNISVCIDLNNIGDEQLLRCNTSFHGEVHRRLLQSFYKMYKLIHKGGLYNTISWVCTSWTANKMVAVFQLQMLGYDMSWAGFNIIEVMSSSKFTYKRIGYLASSQCFHADTEVNSCIQYTRCMLIHCVTGWANSCCFTTVYKW